jgi:3'-phosphoadenosine 5'-phosphosulfate sulfotransferase (PAPS reductase)/FAD synthetase
MKEPTGTVNHFGLSGGKDSTALLGWALNESGYPVDSIRLSSSDTEYEYPETYQQIRDLSAIAEARGVRPIRILKSEGFLNLAIRKGRFPSAKVRFCTQFLKMIPFMHYCEELQLEGHEVIGHSGVRKSESIERSVMDEWGTTNLSQSRQPNIIRIRRPLLEWSIGDVWGAHTRWGLPINPLYKQGRKRVGCELCIMSNKRDVRITVRDHPEVIDKIRRWEQQVGAARKNKGSVAWYSSLFHRTTVPEAQRSMTVFSKSEQREVKIATIDDVARWSNTLRGGVQGGFDFMFEEDDWNDFDAAAPCQSGYCE